jgi:hypothetical protein
MSNFPTLDGLNNIDADSGNLTNITCETFIATTSAQVPTMIAGDDSTNVANTEFVTDALSTATANLVTTNTSQTITLGSVKTFLTLPQSTATVSNNEDLTTKKYVDDNFINIIGNQTLTTGVKTFTVLPQSAATPSSTMDLTTKKYVDDNFINIVGNQTLTSGVKTFTNLPQSTATPSNNADLINKLYVDNIITGLTGSYVSLSGNQVLTSGVKTFTNLPQSTATPINNADLTNKLYVDNLFSGATGSTGGVFVTLLGNQTLGAGVKTFTDLPTCTAVPINNADLTNKLYVDNLFSGATGAGVFVTLTGTQTLGSGIKTFTDLPRCAATPSDYRELVNKDYVDNIVGGLTGTYIGLTGNQTISGTKTFNSLPKCNVVPSANDDLINKLYVDNAVSGITGSFVTLGGNQVLTAGIKTFTDLPECTAVPSNNANLTNKSYVDNNFVNLVGSQTLTTGVKTFTNLPQSTAVPSSNADFTNKLYVDNAVAAVAGGTGTFVTLSTSQTLTTGVKTFTNLPQSTAVPSSNADFTNKLYVDNNFVALTGTQTITGAKTFNTLPESSVTPTTANQLVPKTYVDSNFVDLTGSQTITGNKTFDASTTTIRGTLLDVFPTTTQLYSATTNIAGSSFFLNSTSNTIAGTTTYLTSPTVVVNNTVNSFYVDASYSNFVGDEFLLNSPYAAVGTPCNLFEVNPTTLRLMSPTISVQDTCSSFTVDATNTYFTGTNTDLTLTNAVATTQISSDNSTKLATTAFVNAHTLANYMTTNTNQIIPATTIKTYGGKQVFNAGTACNTYDATGVTDMTLANNSAVAILNIAGDRIRTDTYGVRLALQRYNLQLSEGTFIQPNDAPGFNDYIKPDFAFGVNKITGYVDIVGVPHSAQASIQMNNLAGIFSWFAGYNQTTTFTISHSIITTSTAGIASMNEAEVYFYFEDFNTGIVRYTTPNLATTTGFTLLPNSTFVRPIITFTLTTAQLPQGDYRIFGYSRVTNAYASNAGFLSVNFGLPASPSTETAIQNYNTPIDYTFTSRNLYHIFRNTAMCGVYLSNNIATQQEILTPIHYSITDFTNFMSQPTISGAVSTPATSTSGSAVGNFNGFSVNNSDNRYIVYPNYSIILYDGTGWATPILLNFKNTTSNPVCVAPTTSQAGSSCRIYFDEVELIKY